MPEAAEVPVAASPFQPVAETLQSLESSSVVGLSLAQLPCATFCVFAVLSASSVLPFTGSV